MTTTSTRRGFTLVELLVVMVILGVVGAAIVRTLTTASRISDSQSQRTAMQGNLRAGAGLIPSELREINIDASGSDLIAIGKDSVKYRAMRRLAIACTGASDVLAVRRTNSFGLTGFSVGTGLFLYVENDPTLTSDDIWATFAITNVSTGACPDGSAATLLKLDANLPAGVVYDAPLRTYQDMTLKVYDSGGRKWLGLNDGSGLQPVLGPLAAADSTFGFRDGAGAVTATPSSVRVIEAWLHGETEGKVSSGYNIRQFKQDSLRVRIRLRNAS